jgi:hypothetical protein
MINRKSIQILNKKYKREIKEKQEKIQIQTQTEPWVLYQVLCAIG